MANLTKYVGTNLSDNQYKRLMEIAKERQKPLAFIIRDALKQVYDIPPKDQEFADKPKNKPLRDYEFYCMWKDRTDMEDSVQWVRKQRESWEERLSRN